MVEACKKLKEKYKTYDLSLVFHLINNFHELSDEDLKYVYLKYKELNLKYSVPIQHITEFLIATSYFKETTGREFYYQNTDDLVSDCQQIQILYAS